LHDLPGARAAALGRAGEWSRVEESIDEAHNILCSASFREAEGWKDCRLETFEKVMGREELESSSRLRAKGPATFLLQSFHRLTTTLSIDSSMKTIASAVSYVDHMTEESIPALPIGTCIFGGVASQNADEDCGEAIGIGGAPSKSYKALQRASAV
jgi:hypothetical protein